MKTEKDSGVLSRKKPALFFRYISKMKGGKRTALFAAPKPFDLMISFGGVMIGVTLIVWLSGKYDLLVVASFGASAVLVFGIPDAPMAQPRNVILGNIFSAASGVAVAGVFGLTWWSPALGAALALMVMLLTKTAHPPGGAVALHAVMYQDTVSFVFWPMGAGAIILVVIGLLVNNLSPNRRYPKYWL